MTLSEFSAYIETYAPAGWTFWAGGHRETYNQEKQITDTMLLVLPNPYPVDWRGACKFEIEFSLWFGKLIEIKRTTTGEQQHDPYSPLELRSGLYTTVAEVIEELSTCDSIKVVSVTNGTFYDSPDGKSVNRQVWLEVPIKAVIYS